MKILRLAVPFGVMAGLLAACGGNTEAPSIAAAGKTASAQRQGAAPLVSLPVIHAPSEYRDLVQQVYLAYFGRPADSQGLQFWMQIFSNRGLPLQASDLLRAYMIGGAAQQVIDQFVNSAESQELYTGNNQAFINSVYRNIFNRNAEPEGLVFWAGFLERKQLTRGQLVLNVLVGAQNDDMVIEKKKAQASVNFTAALDARGSSAILGYSGDHANQAARELLASIDASTDIASLQPQVEALIDKILNGSIPVVARYSGFSYLQDAGESGPAYAAFYKYSAFGIVPFTSGSVTYGLVPQMVSWTRVLTGGDFTYSAPAASAASVAQKNGPLPAAVMFCQANGKSTDILVANSLHAVAEARELANQSFSVYKENCTQAGGKSLAFDANGAAVGSGTGAVLKAYRYTAADGAERFLVVLRQGQTLGMWTQQ